MFNNLVLSFAIFCFLNTFTHLEAAAPITHAYLTKNFFKHFPKYTKEQENEFMVGTLFPDIRYLGEVSRTDTHCEQMTLEEILAETNPFTAGVKFHCYVDIYREDLLVKQGIYDKLRERVPLHVASFLKLVEDEILYEKGSWSETCCSLISIHPGERAFGISDRTITKWHKLLTMLFISSPSYALNLFALTGKSAMGISAEEFKSWSELLKPISKEPMMREWVQKMSDSFDGEYDAYKARLSIQLLMCPAPTVQTDAPQALEVTPVTEAIEVE